MVRDQQEPPKAATNLLIPLFYLIYTIVFEKYS